MVSLKGSPKGIMVVVDEENLEIAKEELREKLRSSAEFFNEDTLEVFLTSTTFTPAEVFLMRPVVEEVLLNTRVTFIEHPPKLLPKQHSPLDDLADDEGITKFVRRNVKMGETLEYDNNLIIIGDVEKGAYVSAKGNIFILGTLLGTAHAGIDGKCDAVIVAMHFLAEEIKIADKSLCPKITAFKKFLPGVPEIAYILDNDIKIEQYT